MVIPMQKMKMLTVTLTMEAVLTKRKKLKNKGETGLSRKKSNSPVFTCRGKCQKLEAIKVMFRESTMKRVPKNIYASLLDKPPNAGVYMNITSKNAI
jgi:hypothetical protein